MYRHHAHGIARGTTRSQRAMWWSLCGAALLFLTHSPAQAAIGGSSASTLAPSASLESYSDVDLFETAFREGAAQYDAGNYTAAVQAWRAPASHGHVSAQFSLGVAYALGRGVAVDVSRAIPLWEAAAEQGHVGAQFNLGLVYALGQGVERDLAKARLWWYRAAHGGDSSAQFQLGVLAVSGDSQVQNLLEAAHWWRLAAAQGNEQALRGLEILKDYGVLPDQSLQ